MKTTIVALASLAALATAQAQDASSVVLYGSIDVGVTWVDNIQGNDRWFVGSGSKLSNRLGFRGRESLGNDLAAVFTIEHGFNADDGTIGQGGRMWGRQSFVGLASKTVGTLTLGRQYDFLYAGSPMPLDMGAFLIGGLAGASAGAGTSVDNHLGGVRYDNTIKWQHSLGPVTAGAMWGLGSENKTDKMASAALVYRDRSLWVGAAYLRDNFSPAASGNKIASASVNWDATAEAKLVLNWTQSKAYVGADTRSRNDMLQGGVLYKLTQPLSLGVMAGHSKTKNVANVDGKLQQLGAGFAYNFSRRTEFYGIASHVKSEGSTGTAYSSTPGIGAPAASFRSNDNTQLVLKTGIRHSF
ncbi:porin [Piscinibacter gummiphilus]|uniref:Porin n=1 Tax=Piscinibacter gummiphilus TaxID=946333 RepID=A0ABZ0CRQ3_9BURK|nr:porin [Piscinibacter gummiphilus]WOB07652.1 porin [Piscinibacter gummiphilus]